MQSGKPESAEGKTSPPPAPEQKRRSPLKEQTKRLRRIEKLETLIDELDGKLAALNAELSKPEVYSDYMRINELQARIDELKNTQNAYLDEWTKLSEMSE